MTDKKKFKQFDTISMIELKNVYQELIGELKKDDWSVSTDKFEKKAVNEMGQFFLALIN